MSDLIPTPKRPDDPREAAIWDDVYGTGETDLEYFRRRCKEVGMKMPEEQMERIAKKLFEP